MSLLFYMMTLMMSRHFFSSKCWCPLGRLQCVMNQRP